MRVSTLWIFLLLFMTANLTAGDLLFYYHPDSLVECARGGDISNLGVRFRMESDKDSFSINSIQLLSMVSIPFQDVLYIYSDDGSDSPGDLIEAIQVIVEDSTGIDQGWISVDVTNYAALQNLQGGFWITGPMLMTTFCDFSKASGNSFAYWISLERWEKAEDFSIRVMISENTADAIVDESIYTETEQYRFITNYPNPFNARTIIHYRVSTRTQILLNVFDIDGREIETILKGIHDPGEYRIIWNAGRYNSGVYFICLKSEGLTWVRKCVLLK